MYLLLLKPAYQALLFLLLTPILLLVLQPKNADTAWTIASYLFILFLLINSGLLWLDERPWRYFFYSIGSALGYLLFIAILMPVLLRALQLKGSGESAMTFLVLIYHPFALLLVLLVKWTAGKLL